MQCNSGSINSDHKTKILAFKNKNAHNSIPLSTQRQK